MQIYLVYIDGVERDSIAAADYDKAMMIAEAKYPGARIKIFLADMG